MPQTQKQILTDLLLANSCPEKKETGDIIVPCFTSRGYELMKTLFESDENVRPVLIDVCWASMSNEEKLAKLESEYPNVALFKETLGLEV